MAAAPAEALIGQSSCTSRGMSHVSGSGSKRDKAHVNAVQQVDSTVSKGKTSSEKVERVLRQSWAPWDLTVMQCCTFTEKGSADTSYVPSEAVAHAMHVCRARLKRLV